MYKHLFLEGDIQTGKSTLIRKYIAPHIDNIGGFSSQRLTDEAGETIAFRIVTAQNLQLSVPYENTPCSIFRIISDDSRGLNKPDIFENEGLKLLSNAAENKLILLDEIGGIELRNSAFLNRLDEILSGDIPCIGVIKQNKKAASMSCLSKKTSVTAELNNQLREKMLNEYNCKIIQFKQNSSETETIIHDFINNIFNK